MLSAAKIASIVPQKAARRLEAVRPVVAGASLNGRVNLSHMWGDADRIRGWADHIQSLWARGAIKPKIARVFTFDEAPLAHHFIQDRKNLGKVLLKPF
jgi:NADPH:quinone reductase-like Zn-dependent oxidoreductase